jgi:hypothetical protein
MDAVKVPSGLYFGPSKLKKAFVSLHISMFLYQKTWRLGTYEDQEQQDDSGNYRGREEDPPIPSNQESTKKAQKYTARKK